MSALAVRTCAVSMSPAAAGIAAGRQAACKTHRGSFSLCMTARSSRSSSVPRNAGKIPLRWASVRECHPSSRLRRSQSRLSKVRATTVAKSPINAPYKNKNASGGGLEFSGVGAGAQSQTNSAPTPKAAPTPTANVIKPSRRYRNQFIGPEYEAARSRGPESRNVTRAAGEPTSTIQRCRLNSERSTASTLPRD
jgi:hypothetical protein